MENKWVLITGASGDIGRITTDQVLKFTEFNIILTTNSKKLNLDSGSQRINQIEMDASCMESIIYASKKLSEYPISHFIQLHGNSRVNDSLVNQTEDSLYYHFNINVFSTIFLLQKTISGMQKRKFGRIVLMNTASSEYGGGLNSFGYGMAKHSVGYLTKHLAKYFTKYNILSNCISPGLIKTKFQTEVMKRTPKEITERAKTVRLGKAGMPEDINQLIYYLAFKNDFISGENIKIDGGDFI
jgi:NAD(P)-dependent dehydrogenase (short-subunit alcohol dehydrogenase family)